MRLEPFHQDVSIEQPTENIKHILDKLTNVSLPKFVAEVSSYTKDQGAILNKVSKIYTSGSGGLPHRHKKRALGVSENKNKMLLSINIYFI